MNKLKKYFWNVLIALDQLLNVLFAGDPDETISSRLGKIEYRSKAACIFCKFLSLLLGKDHCKKSIEEDEGKDTILK